MIDKGIISSFESDTDRNGDLIMARVLPSTAQTMPTRPLVISWHLRGAMGNLNVGDEVVDLAESEMFFDMESDENSISKTNYYSDEEEDY